MRKNGIQSKWVSIYSYDVFRVVFGLIILGVDFFVYLRYYYSFQGKDALGFILAIMLIVGIVLLANGMDSWRKRDADFERLEKMKRRVEYEKKKAELEKIKKKKQKKK